jgi:hypothetical protein
MTDSRKAILAAMKRQGVNANRLAVSVANGVSRSQVYDYLSGKSDLGTDKVRFLLAALKLKIVPE